MAKVRVAFFVDIMEEHFDGVSNTVHQIIKRIPRDEIDAIFITPHPPKEDIGFPVHQCSYINMYINKGYRIALPKRMKELPGILDAFDPDVIHWTSPSILGRYAINYAKSKKLPVSTIYHTHFPTYADYYIGWLPKSEKIAAFFLNKFFYGFYHDSDAIFTPTKSMKSYLEDKGIAPDKLKIWGRGVDMTLFNSKFRDNAYFEGSVSTEEKKLLFVSRLVKEKETNTLIRLYELMQKHKVNWKLIITGTGPDLSRLQKNMPNALFTGMKKGEELSTIYASADIFIFPSVTETFGNVVLEAMASGLPVIAANAGGPTDIIEDGYSGYLVEPRNEKAFFNAIKNVLGDPKLYKTLRENAISYATNQSWKNLCRELFDTYYSISKAKGS